LITSFAGWWDGAHDGPGATRIEPSSLELSKLSLAQEQQHVAIERIKRATKVLLVQCGFEITIDEIANTCGVSTRTIFRHFGSHDRLIVETVKDIFDSWSQPPSARLPRPADDLDGWLEGLAMSIHTRNAQVLGEAFWGIYSSNGRDSQVLSELRTLRSEFRDRAVSYLASCAWSAAGATSDPPETLVLGFAINLSVFTTRALMVDSDRTPSEIGALTAGFLKTLLQRAVSDTGSAFE
jgi:AcrR family transcriptional regulator